MGRVERLTMASRLGLYRLLLIMLGILCPTSLSRYGYQIPPPPIPPFLDLEILHNNLNDLQDIYSEPHTNYGSNLQTNTQQILQAILEIIKYKSTTQHIDWKKYTTSKLEQTPSPSPYFLSYQNYKNDRNLVFPPGEKTNMNSNKNILKRFLPGMRLRA